MSFPFPSRPLAELTLNFDAKRRPVKSGDRKPGPFPYYGAQGIVDHVHDYLFDGEYVLVAEDGENLRSRKEPVALLARGRFWVNNHAHILQGNEHADTRFLYYAINSADISGYVTGSTIPKLSQGSLNRVVVPCPPVVEQLEIVHLLGSLDDKIELNRRMNETLEAMAQAIFRDWFVDFGPTRRKLDGATDPVEIMGGLVCNPERAWELADLFPGRLGEDGLPEGWKEGTLGDIARAGGTAVSPSEIAPETPYIGLEHMPRRSIALGAWEEASKVSSNKTAFRRGQILFGKLRPYFHKVGIAPVDGVCSTDIVVLDAAARYARSMVAACVSTDEFVAFTDQGSTGTKMPRTSWGNMKKYKIALAPGAVVESFSAIASPLIDKIVTAIHENRTLAATRDLLLPKLMSGEIRLRDTDDVLEAAQ